MEVNNLETNRRAQIGNITIPLLKGEQGYSISRIVKTSGDGGAGSIDTYTVYINTTPETAIGTFQVVNGTGGDMYKNVYDIDNDDIVDRATGDGNGNEITATYETIANVTALTNRVATLEQAGYITKSVADLANYYLKSETYTKQEVNNLCDMIPKFAIEVVSVLPTQDISETTIYLLRDDEETQDVYQEYIYVNNTWERIGGQRIDLSNYYQKSETYSKDELNDKLVSVGTIAPTDGRRVWFENSKNLLAIKHLTTQTINGVTFTPVYDGNKLQYVNVNGTATATAVYNLDSANIDYVSTYTNELPSGTYILDDFSGSTSPYMAIFFRYFTIGSTSVTNIDSVDNSRKLTIDNTIKYASYIRINTGTTVNNMKFYPQLEKGLTETSYEPYYIEKSIKVDNEDFISMSDLVSVGANQPGDGKRVLFKKGKNLFNKNIAIIGGRLDASGGITTQSNGFYSNFIKVKANTTYTKNSPEADAYHRVCFYSDANGSFISKSESNTFTTPGNCKYLRFCGYDTEIDTTMLEESSTVTSYEPYIYPSMNVDNEEWYSKPKVLWVNSAGVTSGSITLNESIENYSYIEVEYSINTYSSFRGVARLTKNSSTSTVGSLVAEFGNGTTDGIICWTARIVINNANTTIERNYCLNITTSGNTAMSDNYISVLKILGYKE